MVKLIMQKCQLLTIVFLLPAATLGAGRAGPFLHQLLSSHQTRRGASAHIASELVLSPQTLLSLGLGAFVVGLLSFIAYFCMTTTYTGKNYLLF